MSFCLPRPQKDPSMNEPTIFRNPSPKSEATPDGEKDTWLWVTVGALTIHFSLF